MGRHKLSLTSNQALILHLLRASQVRLLTIVAENGGVNVITYIYGGEQAREVDFFQARLIYLHHDD